MNSKIFGVLFLIFSAFHNIFGSDSDFNNASIVLQSINERLLKLDKFSKEDQAAYEAFFKAVVFF